MTNKAVFTKDLANRKMHVSREFAAPIEIIWAAWTQSEILDKWWAPKPWKAETITMNFNNNGLWFYCMVGPAGERHYSRVDILEVAPGKSYSAEARFSDAKGEVPEDAPVSHWYTKFSAIEGGTKVEIDITFNTEATMNTMIAMGFEQGFTMGMANLDELLAEA